MQLERADNEIHNDWGSFTLVKRREYTPVYVYKNSEAVLRMGPVELMAQELALHKELLAKGFPIARILAEKVEGGQLSYLEENLGDKLIFYTMKEEYEDCGRVGEESFNGMVELVEKFATAQVLARRDDVGNQAFYNGMHFELMAEEVPAMSGKLEAAWKKMRARVENLPSVFSHGDMNTYNMLPKGVIDFGSSFVAPFGYDLIVNAYTHYMFPASKDMESKRCFVYMPEQEAEYLRRMDALGKKLVGYAPSDYSAEFTLARMSWSAVRMQHTPKLQAWRYQKMDKALDAYLNGGDVIKVIKED